MREWKNRNELGPVEDLKNGQANGEFFLRKGPDLDRTKVLNPMVTDIILDQFTVFFGPMVVAGDKMSGMIFTLPLELLHFFTGDVFKIGEILDNRCHPQPLNP